jgi:hypothetical protein
MQRRTAIRNLAIISAGVVFLPSCRNTDQAGMALKNISVSSKQQDMLAELTETIIPKTKNFIGAKDLRSHEFLLTMIDDCASPEEQRSFTAGMKAFEDACDQKFHTSFARCTLQQRAELLKDLEADKNEKNAAAGFYRTTKGYTVQNFTTCKNYLLDVRHWKMVPGGDFRGCVKI